MFLNHYHLHLNAFKNKEIDSLYFTSALITFASGLISIFEPIYLWELGFEIWQIILFFLLRSAYFVALLFLVVPLIKKLSDKMMMALGIPFLVLYFFGLSFLGQVPELFYILPAIFPLFGILYFLGYHTDFSSASDGNHIGEEAGTGMAINSFVKFASPFIGGILIGFFGFNSSFLVASIILIISIIPLFFFPRRKIQSDLSLKAILNNAFYRNKKFSISSLGYASEKMVDFLIWPLFIFIAIGSIEQLGGIISLGLLAGGIATMASGVLSDKGKDKEIISFGSMAMALVWFLRTFIFRPFFIVFSQAFYYIFSSAVLASWVSDYYKLAGKSVSLGAFIMSQEFIYNLSRVFTLGILTLLAFILPQETFFISAFIIAGLLSFLYIFANKK
ncbi:MAG: hypothetical protein WD607_11310 [Candidatus Paceibacterota bacterium]